MSDYFSKNNYFKMALKQADFYTQHILQLINIGDL